MTSLEFFYDSFGERIGSYVLGRHRKAAGLMGKYMPTANPVYLDVACGAGASTDYFRQTLGLQQVYGIDISRSATEAARARGINAEVVNIDHDDFPFDDASFDLIFCGELLEHIINIDHLLEEIHRVLRDGGVVVFTVANLAAWYNRIALLLGWQPYLGGISYRHNVGHPHFFGMVPQGAGRLRPPTPRALRQLLRLNQLPVIELQTVSYFEGQTFNSLPLRLMSAADQLIAKFPGMGGDIVVAARKESSS